MDVLWELLEEVVREVVRQAVEGMDCGLLDEEARELAEGLSKDLLERAVSSSDANSSGEFDNLEEEEEEEEFDGILTEDILVKGLSNLSHSATGLQQAYLHLSLPNCKLSDISILCDYIHLQKLELPFNKITDLRCIRYMPYLLLLDASHNALNSLAGLKLPKNIKEVDFSFNQITGMKELSEYPFLSKLNLSNNQLITIEGLQNCRSLTYLSMAKNRLLDVSGLDNLPIKFLFLQGNQLTNVKGLANMKRLHKLDLSNNKIETLIGLEDHDLLETINLENNQIGDLDEIMHIENLQLLRELNLLQNPIQENPDYLFWILFIVQKLTNLDNKDVKATDKVQAMNKYKPVPEVVAASDHMTNIMYSLMQPQGIYDSTLPNFDIPYPMLVLVGAQASGKRELCHMLCQDFSEYFGYCINHTSRSPYLGEENGSDYHFVSDEEFEGMIQMGKFLETMKYNGHYFGLSRDALETVARNGLACCTHMELEGIYSLKMTYLEPRYILLIPQNKEEHAKRLQIRGHYEESQINYAVSRVDNYISMNQEFPGYFDAVINTDNLVDAYMQLSKLIKEYLSLNDPTSDDSHQTTEGEKWQMSDLLKNAWSGEIQQNWSTVSWTVGLPAEFLDSSTRNYSSRVQARLSAEKSILEQNSIEQRQKITRDAVIGRTQNASTYLFKRARAIGNLKNYDASKLTSLIPVASYISQDRSFSSVSSSEATQMGTKVSSLSSTNVFTEESKIHEIDTDYAAEVTSKMLLKLKSVPLSSLTKTLEGAGDTDGTQEEPARPETPKELQPLSKNLLASNKDSSSPRLGFNIKPVLPGIPSGRTTAEIPIIPKQILCNLK